MKAVEACGTEKLFNFFCFSTKERHKTMFYFLFLCILTEPQYNDPNATVLNLKIKNILLLYVLSQNVNGMFPGISVICFRPR